MSWGRHEDPDYLLKLLVVASVVSLLASVKSFLAGSLVGTLLFLTLPVATAYTLWQAR